MYERLRLLAAVGIVCVMAATLATAARPQSHHELTVHSIERYVLPTVAAFAKASEALAATTRDFCAAPSPAKRGEVVGRFREALLAWARAEVIRTGPATRAGRAQMIAFWPDPRGVVERQMRLTLAQRPAEVTSAASLRTQSAALQGFPALEILLTDKTHDIGAADDEGRYRCQFATAIAGNIAALAHEIEDGWTKQGGWRDHMLSPGSDNPDFPSSTTSAGDMFKSLTTSLQAILEAQIQPLAQAGADKAGPAPSQPYKRLGLSREYLLSGIKGCHALYDAANLASYLDPSDAEQAKVGPAIAVAFAALENRVASKEWDAAVGKKQQKNSFVPARVAASELGGIRRLLATKVADAAHISHGFNELDGD